MVIMPAPAALGWGPHSSMHRPCFRDPTSTGVWNQGAEGGCAGGQGLARIHPKSAGGHGLLWVLKQSPGWQIGVRGAAG